MAEVTLGGNPQHTNGELPKVGSHAIDFELVNSGLSSVNLSNYAGKKVVLNIFPSIDTPTCATSVRTFNQKASELADTVVLCISHDLPFAQKRFCGAEGLNNVETLSDFRGGKFGKDYGIELTDGPLKGLHARSVVVLNANHDVVYNELVPDIKDEPNYDAALKAL